MHLQLPQKSPQANLVAALSFWMRHKGSRLRGKSSIVVSVSLTHNQYETARCQALRAGFYRILIRTLLYINIIGPAALDVSECRYFGLSTEHQTHSSFRSSITPSDYVHLHHRNYYIANICMVPWYKGLCYQPEEMS